MFLCQYNVAMEIPKKTEMYKNSPYILRWDCIQMIYKAHLDETKIFTYFVFLHIHAATNK